MTGRRIEPGPGQESVWDYPRPPRVEADARRVVVRFRGQVIADTVRALRVLETSHPPVFYLPPEDVDRSRLVTAERRTFCEFKGEARYFHLEVDGHRSSHAAWSYPEPTEGFEALRDHLAFYPSRVEECRVGEERVEAQDGDFYGGWITSEIVGPFKGGAGTWGW